MLGHEFLNSWAPPSNPWPERETTLDTTKDLARALRRHNAARIKENRDSYWGRRTPSDGSGPLTPRQLGILLNTPQVCSSYCCGNARKWFGELTMQERKAEQHTVEELLGDVA